MKDQEERELNGEVALNAEEVPVKSGEQANGDIGASKLDATTGEEISPSGLTERPDGESTANSSLPGKGFQLCDSAQGALGQVKAKVEVCKDESIGKDCTVSEGPSWQSCLVHTLTSQMLLVELEEFRSYLEKCFDFEQVTVKKFRTWAERRQFNRDMKRKQAESERPILPANQKLITLSVQDAPTKKGNS